MSEKVMSESMGKSVPREGGKTTRCFANEDACLLLSPADQEQVERRQLSPRDAAVYRSPESIVDLEVIADAKLHGGTCASPAVGSPINKNKAQPVSMSVDVGAAARNLQQLAHTEDSPPANVDRHKALPLPDHTFKRMIMSIADCFSSIPSEGQKKILKSFALVHFDCPRSDDDVLGMCFKNFDQETQKKVLHVFFSVYANEGLPWSAAGQSLSPAEFLYHLMNSTVPRASFDSNGGADFYRQRANTWATHTPWSPPGVASARLSISAPHMFLPGLAGWHVTGDRAPAVVGANKRLSVPPAGRPVVVIVPPKPVPMGQKRIRYSRKVFVGGTPWDVVEDSLIVAFSPFGSAHVEWPKDRPGVAHRRTDGKTGYVYVLFDMEQAVERLVHTCRPDASGRMWLDLELTRENGIRSSRNVEVIPWVQSDSHWSVSYYMENVGGEPDPRKTVFVGGLHGRISAYMLAYAMDQLFGAVVATVIDLDRHKYPIGSGRVVFASEQSQRQAIGAQFVHVSDHVLRESATFAKTIQVEQYLSPHSPCSVCDLSAPTVVYCRHPSCADYLCETHWKERHCSMSEEERARHRKVQRRAAHVSRLTVSSGDWAMWQHTSLPGTRRDSRSAADVDEQTPLYKRAAQINADSFGPQSVSLPETVPAGASVLADVLNGATDFGFNWTGMLPPPNCPPPSPALFQGSMQTGAPAGDWQLGAPPPPSYLSRQRCGRPHAMTNTGRNGFGPNAPVSYF